MKEIKEKISELDQRLNNLGPPMPSETREKQALLWTMVTQFITEFKNTLGGRDSQRQNTAERMKSREMRGGAKIKEYFEELYVDFARNFKATKEYADSDIEQAIQLHEGDQLAGFPSVDVFHYLVRPKLDLLVDPAQDCLSDCHLYIEQMADEIATRVFPVASQQIMEIVSNTLYKQMERTKKVVDAIIEAENGYQFTNDKDYLETRTEIVPAEDAHQKGNPHGQAPPPKADSKQSRRKIYVDEIRKRIDEYFRIVIRGIRDSVPKAIGFFLVQGI